MLNGDLFMMKTESTNGEAEITPTRLKVSLSRRHKPRSIPSLPSCGWFG